MPTSRIAQTDLVDRHIQARLKQDVVAWLVTVGKTRPHAVLVWYLWDGETFLVYSVPGLKVRDIEGNPNVQLHLNSDPKGDEMVRIAGTARIARDEPPAAKVAAYVRKYRRHIQDLGYTVQQFSEQYHVPIRITPLSR